MFILFLVLVFLFSSIAPNIADAKAENPVQENELIDETFDKTTLEILNAIENIPQEELEKGPEFAKNWFNENTSLHVTLDSKGNLQFNTQSGISTFGVIACSTAIGVALVSNVFSITKITKIKSAIKALGGVKKAASSINKWYKKYREGGFSRTKSIEKAMDKASAGLGSEVKLALLDFFSLTNVMAACFE